MPRKIRVKEDQQNIKNSQALKTLQDEASPKTSVKENAGMLSKVISKHAKTPLFQTMGGSMQNSKRNTMLLPKFADNSQERGIEKSSNRLPSP